MSFWTSEQLKQRLPGSKTISDYDPGKVDCGAYELAMGAEYFLTCDADGKKLHVKQTLKKGQQFVIPAGQFALLLTEETLRIPDNVMCLISIKAGVKFKGLVNISGFHVDPGYQGKLMFAVHNAGTQSIRLQRGQQLFPLWFAQLGSRTFDLYSKKKSGRSEITCEDIDNITGDVVSSFDLKNEIESLKKKMSWVMTVGITVCVSLVLPIWILSYEKLFLDSKTSNNVLNSDTAAKNATNQDVIHAKSQARLPPYPENSAATD